MSKNTFVPSKRIIVIIMIVLYFFIPALVNAGIKVKNFRCGDRVIRVGMSKFTAIEMCGEPTSRETRVIDGRAKKEVEEWYYNCGSDRRSYLLFFEKRNLRRIERVGYGKGESECLGGLVKKNKAVINKKKETVAIQPQVRSNFEEIIQRMEKISKTTDRPLEELMEEVLNYLEEKYKREQ